MKTHFKLGLAAVGLFVSASLASAQTFPNRTITVVVPFAAGGSTDVVARLIAQKMSENLGQQLIIENRVGAGGNVGASAVAKATPDGYTVLYGTISTHTLNPLMAKRSAYDPVKDFTAISLVGNVPNVMVVHPSLGVSSVKELIALVKANPGKHSYASSGVATPLHLSGEMFNKMAGTDMVHVPYRGAGPAMNDLVAGQVKVMFDNLPTSLEFIKAGSIKPLAVTTKTRSPSAPDVPTMEEAGLPGYETYSWQAFFAPPGTPKDIVDRLNASVLTALKDPALIKKLNDFSVDIVGSSPEALGKHVVDQLATWTPITKATGVQVE